MSDRMDPHGEFVAELITSGVRALAAGVVSRQEAMWPDQVRTYGSAGAADLAGDTELRLAHLAEALAAARPQLFLDTIACSKVALAARGVATDVLDANLACCATELAEQLPAGQAGTALEFIAAARQHLAAAPSTLASLLEADAPHVELARRYLLAALEARADDAVGIVLAAHERGVDATNLHRHVLAKCQQELGRMWLMNEIHVGEEHLGSQVTMRAMTELSARVVAAPALGLRALCSGVPGDIHELGLRSVADHLRWTGFDVVMLGASTPAPDLILAVVDFRPDVIVLSASLVLHVRVTAKLIRLLRERLGACPPILLGGRPFSIVPDLWRVVGADASAAAVGECAERILTLVAPSG